MRRAALASTLALLAAIVAWRAWPRRAPATPQRHGDVAVGARDELIRALSRAPRLAPATPAAPTGTPLDVRVVDGVGAPVAGARVDVVTRTNRTQLATAVSDAHGIATVVLGNDLPIDDVAAIAHAANGDEGAIPTLDDDLPIIEVGPIATLRGVVVDARGEPVDGARLDVRGELDWRDGDVDPHRVYRGPIPPPAVAIAADAEDLDAIVHTAGDGTFVVPLRGPDVYDVVVVAEGTAARVSAPVQLLPGTDAFVRVVLDPGATAAGCVVDAQGAPVAHASVSVAQEDVAVDTQTDDAGVFRIDGLTRADTTVEVHAQGFLPARTALPLDAPGTVVTMDAGATLDVHACVRTGATDLRLSVSGHYWRVGIPAELDAQHCASFHVTGLEGDDVHVALVGPALAAPLARVQLRRGEVTRLDVVVPRLPVTLDTPPSVRAPTAAVYWDEQYLSEGALPYVVDVAASGALAVYATGTDADGHGVMREGPLDRGSSHMALALARDPGEVAETTPAQILRMLAATDAAARRPAAERSCEPTSYFDDTDDATDDAVHPPRVDISMPPASQRLFAGDRVLSVDGVPYDDPDRAMPALDGPCGERVQVVVLRPALRRSLLVTLVR